MASFFSWVQCDGSTFLFICSTSYLADVNPDVTSNIIFQSSHVSKFDITFSKLGCSDITFWKFRHKFFNVGMLKNHKCLLSFFRHCETFFEKEEIFFFHRPAKTDWNDCFHMIISHLHGISKSPNGSLFRFSGTTTLFKIVIFRFILVFLCACVFWVILSFFVC